MKMDKYMNGRNDGLVLALKIVHEDGIEGLEKEMKFRGATEIHTGVAVKDLDAASQAIKEMTLDCVLALMVHTIHDEFGFGEKRCQRLINRFNLKAGCLAAGLASWKDITDQIKEELDLDLTIRYND